MQSKTNCHACDVEEARAWAHLNQLANQPSGLEWVWWSLWLSIVLVGALAAVKLVRLVFRAPR